MDFSGVTHWLQRPKIFFGKIPKIRAGAGTTRPAVLTSAEMEPSSTSQTQVMPDPAPAAEFAIRLYRPADRQQVRDICVQTCWMGEYRPDYIPSEHLWAEFWTRYFTDVEPQHTWVLQREADGKLLGYLCGTADARAADHYGYKLMPGIAWHIVRQRLLRRRASRRALWSMLKALLRGELNPPKGVHDEYPAAWHFDLLPDARRGGWGRKMLAMFIDQMRAEGVRGIHGQPLSINPPVARALESMGFTLLSSRPTCAFAHVETQRIEVQTWVMKLAD